MTMAEKSPQPCKPQPCKKCGATAPGIFKDGKLHALVLVAERGQRRIACCCGQLGPMGETVEGASRLWDDEQRESAEPSETGRARDARYTITIKGNQFTPEFRMLINDAARSMGLTQAEFIHQALFSAANDRLRTEGAAVNETRLDRLERALSDLMETISPALEGKAMEYPEVGSPAEREAQRDRQLRAFKELGVDVQPYSDGLVLIEGRYVVSLLGNRWRVSGKAKWYWYRDAEQLVNTHIRKGAAQ